MDYSFKHWNFQCHFLNGILHGKLFQLIFSRNSELPLILTKNNFKKPRNSQCLEISQKKKKTKWKYEINRGEKAKQQIVNYNTSLDQQHSIRLQFVDIMARGLISKRVLQENKVRQIFQKTNISYPLIRTCGKKCSFFGKFGVLCFLVTSFRLIADKFKVRFICYRLNHTKIKKINKRDKNE